MKKKQFGKRLTAFLLLLVAVGCLFGVIAPVLASADDPIRIEIVPETETGPIALPAENQCIYFRIRADRDLPAGASVTVRYRTRSESAVASTYEDDGTLIRKGDFEPVDREITLTDGSSFARLAVCTYQQEEIGIRYTGKIRKDVTETRTFGIEIVSITCRDCEAAIAPDAQYLRCGLLAGEYYDVTTPDDKQSNLLVGSSIRNYSSALSIRTPNGTDSCERHLFYTDYLTSDLCSYASTFYFDCDDDDDEPETQLAYSKIPESTISKMQSKFIDTGMAHAYAAITSYWASDDTTFFSCTEKNEFHVRSYKKGSSAGDGTVAMYFKTSQTHNNGSGFGADVLKQVYLSGSSWGWLSTVSSNTSSKKDETYLLYGKGILFRVPYIHVAVQAYNDCGMDDKDYTIGFSSTIVDDIRPTVTDVFYDNVPLYAGDKARIAVRFSENVQTSSSAHLPYLTVETTSTPARTLIFNYAGGTGTNTLWFEYDLADYPMDETVLAITVKSIAGDICDLSYNYVKDDVLGSGFFFGANYVDVANTVLPKTYIPFRYDFRTPTLTLTNEAALSEPSTTKLVSIRLSDANDATVRYGWSDTLYPVGEGMPADATVTWENNMTAAYGGDVHSIDAPVGVTGSYYLYVSATSPLGRTRYERFGPFPIDNVGPEVADLSIDPDTLTAKTVRFRINDDYSKISDLSLLFYAGKTRRSDDPFTDEIALVRDRAAVRGGMTYDLSGEGRTATVTLPLTAADFGLASNEYGSFLVAFRTVDALGNERTSEPLLYHFDTRPIFTSELSETDGAKIAVTAEGERAYTLTKDVKVTLKLSGTSVTEEAGGVFSLSSITKAGEDLTADLISGGLVSFDPSTLAFAFSKNIPVGYYEVVFACEKSGSTKYSVAYGFYLVNGEEDTENFLGTSGDLLLRNDVFRLNTDYFSLAKDAGGIVTLTQKPYSGSSLPMTFSSPDAAAAFVSYYEKQDMYIEILSENAATLLNRTGGDNNYSKATGETTIAKEGQLWIRYKRADWREPYGKDDLSGWCYYYYAPNGNSSTPIDPSRFTPTLTGALDAVTSYIVSRGESVRLLGVPKLDPAQIATARLSAPKTNNGTSFSSPVSFEGDGALYRNTVSVDGADVPLVTTYPWKIGDHTRIYLSTAAAGPFTEYFPANGTTFAALTSEAGDPLSTDVYYVREFDDNGMREYPVYVDKTAPLLNVSYTVKSRVIGEPDETVKITFNKRDNDGGLYSARSFEIGTIAESEPDTCAYVVVANYHTGDVLNIYDAAALRKSSVLLGNGYYSIRVGDRSGNDYFFSVRVSDEDLSVSVSTKENRLTVSCANRTYDQIYRYLIYRDSYLVTDSFEQRFTTEMSGYYSVYVEDVYGSVFEWEDAFSRTLPEVTWYYLDGGVDRYTQYVEGVSTAMEMIPAGASTFLINSARELRFSYSGAYAYTVTGGTATEVYDTFRGLTYVTLKADGDLSVRIYYENDENLAVTYICSYDTEPPAISVAYTTSGYAYDDLSFLTEANAALLRDGDVLIPRSIAFRTSGLNEKQVTSGSTAYALYFSVDLSDATGIASLSVLLDGEPIGEYDVGGDPFTSFLLSRAGHYEIRATDLFGNVAVFTFDNAFESPVGYEIDGVSQEVPFGLADLFLDGVFTKEEYGKASQTVTLSGDGEISYLVSAGGDPVFFAFSYEDGRLLAKAYVYTETENEEGVIGKAIRFLDDPSLANPVLLKTPGQSKTVYTGAGFTLSAAIDLSGVLSMRVTPTSDRTVTSEVRVKGGSVTEPFYARTLLSSELPKILIQNGSGAALAAIADGDGAHHMTAKTNDSFTIDPASLTESRIVSLEIGYSASSVVRTLYPFLGEGADPEAFFRAVGASFTEAQAEADVFERLALATVRDGYYEIRVRNVFGSETVYTVIRANGFFVVSVVTYEDGTVIDYDATYTDVLYSNRSVEYLLTSGWDDVRFSYELCRGGEKIRSGNLSGDAKITLEDDGVYRLLLRDDYGNLVTREAEIKKVTLTPNEGAITGFNPAALRRDEGYTNTLLSIDPDVILAEGYSYVAIRKGDETKVLFDLLSQNKTALDPETLASAIGKDGDGEYVVTFRDKFGNFTSRVVNVRRTDTLKLSRITRSSGIAEDYPTALAAEIGFWSNNVLLFATDASTFRFTVNGKNAAIDAPIRFDSTAEIANRSYAVEYIDEYGFSYRFDAHLFREVPKLELSDEIEVIPIGDRKYARTGVVYFYDGDATCLCYRDGASEPFAYESGSVLKGDGNYRFEVTDRAGNVASDTITIDTVCEFAFTETLLSKTVRQGGIATTARVEFGSLNADGVKILCVVRDGKTVEDFDAGRITEAGAWEFLLEDRIGNRAYFNFRMIPHAVSALDYTTPAGFKVTEAWYVGADGIRINYLPYVDQGEETSSFSFTENGSYQITMSSIYTNDSERFSFTVDASAPDVSLVGCEEGETTVNTVSITGCKDGDTVRVYRDGKLYRTVHVSGPTEMPEISEGGDYTIVVTSEAGVETRLSFTRTHIANAAGSTMIIIVLFAVVAGLLVGLLLRTRLKTDE